MISLWLFFLVFLLRVLLRREWLAATVFILLTTTPTMLRQGVMTPDTALDTLGMTVFVFVLLHSGLLAVVVALFLNNFILRTPLTLDFSAWYVNGAIWVLVLVAGMAVYAFHATVAGRPLIKDELLQG